MLPLFVPVFAQVVTLGVHDRTEGRYLASTDKRYEASTRPVAELSFGWPRYRLSLGYSPSFLLTPLERKPRDLLVYHSLFLNTGYTYRHTTFGVNGSFSFGKVNFQVAQLQNPAALTPNMGDKPVSTPPATDPNAPAAQPTQPGQQPTPAGGTGTPTTPGSAQPLQPRIVNREVRYETWTIGANVAHQVSRELSLAAVAAYTVGGGLRDADRVDYPLTHGTIVGGIAAYALVWTSRDSFVTSTTAQGAFSSNGNRALSLQVRESWNHRFSKRTSGSVGAGLGITRNSQDNGLVAYSVFPNFAASLGYGNQLARGSFSLAVTAYSTPVLDPLRATVDPQVGLGGFTGWSRGRFSTSLSANTAVSVAPQGNNAGAFNSYSGSLVNAVHATDWLSFDAGGRVANQQYQDVTIVPWSYSIFLGVNLGYAIPLAHVR
jgi:hypothetical protein